MLGDEHGMMPERGLFAVIGWFRRSQPLLDEPGRMVEHGIQSNTVQITPFRLE